MITIAIVEDHRVLVDAMNIYLKDNSEISLAGSAETVSGGSELIQRTKPDVLLLDVGLPDGNGLDLLPKIKEISPDTRVIVLTSFSDENTLMRAINQEVSGFIQKTSSLSELLAAVRRVSRGEVVMPTSLLVGMLKRVPRDKASAYNAEKGWEPLTPREHDVLSMLAKGRSGGKIASELHISHSTVRTHVRNLLGKLGVHSRLEAVSFGLRNGLIDSPG